MKTLDDFDFSGKNVLVRLDINAPVEKRRVQDCLRIRKSCRTLRELSQKGARITILAHQGRKDDKDYTPRMDQHASILSRHLNKTVNYVDDLLGETAKKSIKNLKNGEIILLRNVRSLDEETKNKSPEEHSREKLVRTLAPLFDIFVNDAFSAAHRSHASLVGFIPILPSAAGRLMKEELENDTKIIKHAKHPDILLLGGAKPDDVIDVIESLAPKEQIDKILTAGVIGELFLVASDVNIGETEKWLKRGGFLDRLKDVKLLLEKYHDKILFPEDLAFKTDKGREEFPKEQFPIDALSYDIGPKTIKKYSEIIGKSRAFLMKGPPGIYEEKGFDRGTIKILRAIEQSNAFSVLAGGHTSALVEKYRIKNISHVSVGGGAFIRLLTGKKLPVVEALKKYS